MNQYPARLILGRYDFKRNVPFVSWDEKVLTNDAEAQARLDVYVNIVTAGGPQYEYAVVPLPCVETALEAARAHLERTFGGAGLMTCATCTETTCPYAAKVALGVGGPAAVEAVR